MAYKRGTLLGWERDAPALGTEEEGSAELRHRGLELAGLGVQVLRKLDEQLEQLLRLLDRHVVAGLSQSLARVQALEERPCGAPCVHPRLRKAHI